MIIIIIHCLCRRRRRCQFTCNNWLFTYDVLSVVRQAQQKKQKKSIISYHTFVKHFCFFLFLFYRTNIVMYMRDCLVSAVDAGNVNFYFIFTLKLNSIGRRTKSCWINIKRKKKKKCKELCVPVRVRRTSVRLYIQSGTPEGQTLLFLLFLALNCVCFGLRLLIFFLLLFHV